MGMFRKRETGGEGYLFVRSKQPAALWQAEVGGGEGGTAVQDL